MTVDRSFHLVYILCIIKSPNRSVRREKFHTSFIEIESSLCHLEESYFAWAVYLRISRIWMYGTGPSSLE